MKFITQDRVVVKPNEQDFFHSFVGVVVGFRNGLIQIRDQDDDVWEVDESQLSPVED